MAVRLSAILKLVPVLGLKQANELYHLAKKQDALEARNIRRLDNLWDSLTDYVISRLDRTGKISKAEVEDAMLDLFLMNAKKTQEAAVQSTAKHLAKVPRSLPDLTKIWDEVRKGKVPKREKAFADKVTKEFLRRISKTWEKHSEAYRNGDEQTRKEIAEKMQRSARIGYSRAVMIVRTETTKYYNATRRNIYDSSPDVTHYMFVAIRDYATTKWCKTRDGIVLAKGSDYLANNTPPVHWNCRSEIVPLTPQNPRHKKLIDDLKRRPSNRRLEPLPKGWKPS